MIYGLIIFLLVIALILLLETLSRHQMINTNTKLILSGSALLLILGIVLFTQKQEKQENKITNLAQEFLRGRNLKCQVGTQNLDVNQTHFNFVSGTLTFMGKEGGEYYRKNIPLKACDLGE